MQVFINIYYINEYLHTIVFRQRWFRIKFKMSEDLFTRAEIAFDHIFGLKEKQRLGLGRWSRGLLVYYSS